jgi:hypothetical protein
MARWRLTESHYLDCPDSYWEQAETDRETGKQKRRKMMVPLHLNPKDPNDWNYKTGDRDVSQGGNAFTDGQIIVCREGKGEPKDIVFTSALTPGMEPLDAEAKVESAAAKVELKWRDGDRFYQDGMTYADTIMMELAKREESPGLTEALSMMAKVIEQNAMLLAALAPSRRV